MSISGVKVCAKCQTITEAVGLADYVRGMISKNGRCTVADLKGAMDILPADDDNNWCWVYGTPMACRKQNDGLVYLTLPLPRRTDGYFERAMARASIIPERSA